MASKNYAENFNVIIASELEQNPATTIKFVLQENKKNGNKYLNMRQFTHTDSYDGPTKNGFSFFVESEEEIEMLKNAFNKFFDDALKHF